MTGSPYQPQHTVTELGKEKRCMSCGDYWPADGEFFAVMPSRRDGWSPRCLACIRAKTWQRVRPHRDQDAGLGKAGGPR